MPRRISSGKVGRSVLGDIFAQDNSIRSVETNANIAFSPDGTGIVESNSDIQLNGTSGVRFADSDSSNYVLIKAPSTVVSNVTLTLPANDGDADQVLTTNGSGVLSWGSTGLTVTQRTAADSNPYYLAMVDAASLPGSGDASAGVEDTLSVASDRLSFIPNPGRLSAAEMRATASTVSSSTTTGALVVTGGVGVGGQLTAVDIVETSSIALKENIEPIENGLASILKLKGVTYDRKDNNQHESGLIAEWTEEVLPELVTRDADNNVVGIKYTKLTAYLIEAVKSLASEIETLKGK